MHLECTETQHTFINNCLHSIGPNSDVPYAKGVWVLVKGTFSGPELGENTSHSEKNIIVLEKKTEIIQSPGL